MPHTAAMFAAALFSFSLFLSASSAQQAVRA
jgi:hypothetical protein